jgi:hypothetical protein
MKMKAMVSDAIRYAAADWYNFFILGLVLFLIDHLVDLSAPPLIDSYFDVLLFIITLFLSLVELGYGFRMVEETVQGSKKPPSFHNPFNLFWHGVKESVIFTVYFIFPLIMSVISFFGFESFLGLDLSPIIVDYSLFIAVGLFFAFNIMFQGAVLNMAHHDGSLTSGFNMPMVFRKIRMVGLKNMFMISLITLLLIGILKGMIFDTFHEIPYLGHTLGDVISTVIITPFLIIFTTRLLGLIDVEK